MSFEFDGPEIFLVQLCSVFALFHTYAYKLHYNHAGKPFSPFLICIYKNSLASPIYDVIYIQNYKLYLSSLHKFHRYIQTFSLYPFHPLCLGPSSLAIKSLRSCGLRFSLTILQLLFASVYLFIWGWTWGWG